MNFENFSFKNKGEETQKKESSAEKSRTRKYEQPDLKKTAEEFKNNELAMFEDEEIRQSEKKNSQIGKFKKAIAGITTGIMIFCATPAFAEKTSKEQIRGDKTEEQIAEKQDRAAIKFLKNLTEKLPQEKTTQERAMKKQVILDMLREFALQLESDAYDKERKLSGNIGREQLKKAVWILDRNMADFADQKFGNKDGKTELEEFEKLRQNPNIKELQIIIMRHAR